MSEPRAPDQQKGVLPREAIEALIAEGAIAMRGAPGATQLQPASIDLTLGRRAWRARASFLPGPGRSVQDRLNDGLLMHALDLSEGAVLERGCVYLVELRERLRLPADISGLANPKSSTGRIDVFVRLVTESVNGGRVAFDEIPSGYEGPLYAEVCPRTFSIVAREGSSLNQARFRRGTAPIDDAALADLHAHSPLVDGPARIDNGLQVSVDLVGDAPDAPIGWRARRHAALIDVDVSGACAPEEYFDPIAAPRQGFLILDPDEFYILASAEALAVPPDCAAEMAAVSPGLGEFRVHYAGFFDPGFGWAPDRHAQNPGANGARAVLEVRSHDAPFMLEHGQPVARLAYERMAARPGLLYGSDLASNYQGQSLKLSKHFRAD
ncbi:MAG: 2'-deoxycytidine 5'-triphosphate deaminase [Pseudomonadota bacterium]